jgi:hypothetical protein
MQVVFFKFKKTIFMGRHLEDTCVTYQRAEPEAGSQNKNIILFLSPNLFFVLRKGLQMPKGTVHFGFYWYRSRVEG